MQVTKGSAPDLRAAEGREHCGAKTSRHRRSSLGPGRPVGSPFPVGGASPSGFSFFAVDLEQVLELDSLEYLEALECVTERLESRVNFCKAHLMMITCFDITSRRR